MKQADLQTELNKIAWTGRTYLLQEKVILDQNVPLLIEGCYLKGWYDVTPQYIEPRHSTIEVTQYATEAIKIHGPYAGLGNHVIYYPNQSKYQPNFYPVTISAPKRDDKINPNITLKHLSFFGAMSFISLTGAGQHVIEDIRGQILGTGYGIYIDNAFDVLRIKDIHFWPNFSGDSIKYGYYNPPIFGNTRGIILNRADWSQLSNIFLYGLHVGIQILGVADPQISNLNIDACSVGLDLYSIGQGGLQIDNYRVAGNRVHGAWKCYPVIGRSTITQKLQISNYNPFGDINNIVWNAPQHLLQIGNK